MTIFYVFSLYFTLFISVEIKNCYGEDFAFCPISDKREPCENDVVTEKDKNEHHQDDGGWHTDSTKVLATAGPCNIDVLDSLSQEKFLEEYAFRKPFVIKNVNDNSKFQWLSRKSNMMEKFGGKIVRLSSANTHSYAKRDVTLKQYVTEIMKPQDLETPGNETFYWFGDNNHTEWNEVFSSYNPPNLHVPNLKPVFSYGVADAGTGVPFHFHGPGFSEVVFGRKRWFLYPHGKVTLFDPNLTTLHWLLTDYPRIEAHEMPLECTVGPGQAIYFPDRWWHATLNIDSSVFISTFLG